MGTREVKIHKSPKEDGREAVQPNTGVAERARRITEKADELVEEIDGILEKNAEELVKHFVQRSGE